MSAAAELRAAVAAVRPRLEGRTPAVALILGSGLGALAGEVDDAVAVSYEDIPGLAAGGSVVGHAATLVCGTLEGAPVLAFSGRRHLYEGHDMSTVVLPVRLAAELGVSMLLVTNAAGGVRRTFQPGTLMMIRDHINLLGRSPLTGPVLDGEVRFPDMSRPYDDALCDAMRQSARANGVPLEEGVYAASLGPAYETPAEVRMLERLGVDATGMSTVPEVITAAARGMRVAGVSCISNAAAGYTAAPLDHAEVLEVTARVRGQFLSLVRGWVGRVAGQGAAAVAR